MSDPLSIAASVIALLQLAATGTKYLKDIKHGSTDRQRLRDELRSAVYVLEMLRDRIEEDDELDETYRLKPSALSTLTGTDGPLERFKSLLESIVTKLAPQDRFRRLKQPFTWPFDKTEVAETIASLERLKSHFSLVMQNDLIGLAKIAERKIDQLHTKVDDSQAKSRAKEDQELVAWISQLSFRAKHVDVLGSVHPGTGNWLLEHQTFSKWFREETDTLWCPGIPGAGKTSIASLVIDYVERNLPPTGAVLAYIFCEFGHRHEQTTLSLLSSVLQQVLQQISAESWPAEIKVLYESHKKYSTRPTLTQIHDALEKVMSSLKSCYVVVDALDECSETDDEALELITALYAFKPKLRTLVTSRYSVAFENFFATCARTDISASNTDITTFLTALMARPGSLSRHVKSDPTLAGDIIRTIGQESQGMFLLAKLHIESLARKLTRRDVRKSLKSLPATLDATYSDAVQRIYAQTPELVEVAESVLFWVTAARRSLSLVELQHLYAVCELEEGESLQDDDLPDFETLTGACRGLIVIENESKAIRVVHYTAQQYLEKTHAEHIHTAKSTLAQASLSYLVLPNFASGICTDDQSMQGRLDSYPFLTYAARFWGSDIRSDMDVKSSFRKFVADDVAVQVASQITSVSNSRQSHWSQEFPKNVPALVLVATFEVPGLVSIMINEGHNTEGAGSDGETALIRAAVHDNSEVVKVLLDNGARVDATDHMQETALHRAAKVGATGAVKALIAGNAKVTLRAFNQWTALMAGVTSGSVETVEELLQTSIELNAETSWGDTALSIAIRNGLEKIAHHLVDHGAILSGGRAGRRASTIASRRGYGHLVKSLTARYEEVAGKPLQRQSLMRIDELPAIPETRHSGGLSEAEAPEHMPVNPKEAEEEEFWEKLEDIKGFTYLVGFSNRYIRNQNVASGHAAQVHLCRNKVTGIEYAAKVYPGWSHKNGCLKELRMMLFLQEKPHRNLVSIRECFLNYEERTMTFVMELAEHGDLFTYIVSEQKLTEDASRNLFLQLFSAVDFLHESGFFHRDIKPENILLRDDFKTVKLADFNIMAGIESELDDVHYATTLCGTPSYVAPEILTHTGVRKYGSAVDIWSCGVVLYICLCGFPPFSDDLNTPEHPYTLSQQIAGAVFDYPSPYWDSVSDPALEFIDLMIFVDPRRRLTAKQCLRHPWITQAGPRDATLILGDGLVDEPAGML